MPRLCYATPACLLLMLVSAGTSSAQVELKQKVHPNSTFETVVVSKSNQLLTLVVQGMEIPQVSSSEQTRTVTSKYGARQADGTLTSEEKISSLQAALTLPGGVELEFDSENADAPPAGTPYDGLIQLLKAASLSTWIMTYDQDDRVTSVEGAKEALEALDDGVRDLVVKQFDGDYIQQQANAKIDLLPTTPVAKGDTWYRDAEMRIEGGQTLEFKTKYEYLGPTTRDGKTLDQVGITVEEVSYAVDDDNPVGVQVTESKLKVEDATGGLLLDREQGLIVEQKSSFRITGTMKLVVRDMEIDGKLDLKLENSTKVTPK